jgi:hypothetical protein
MSETTTKKRKASLPILIAGGVSSLVLALGMSPTFSAFTASIANSTNTAGTGTLVMEEKNQAGSVTCLSTDGGSISTNSATCASINKYGGDLAMVPGKTATTTITIKNTGTVDASSFSLAPGACTTTANGSVSGSATDLCGKATVTITANGLPVYTGTATALGTGGTINMLTKLGTPSIPMNNVTTLVFTVKLDATLDNTYQGKLMSQPMTWTFGA